MIQAQTFIDCKELLKPQESNPECFIIFHLYFNHRTPSDNSTVCQNFHPMQQGSRGACKYWPTFIYTLLLISDHFCIGLFCLNYQSFKFCFILGIKWLLDVRVASCPVSLGSKDLQEADAVVAKSEQADNGLASLGQECCRLMNQGLIDWTEGWDAG